MVQSALLAALALTRHASRVARARPQRVQALINAFDTPARQAFVVQMVDARDDLPNAIALNSSMVNGARLLGPSIAGVLIAAVGEGWCFVARRRELPGGHRVAAGHAHLAARDCERRTAHVLVGSARGLPLRRSFAPIRGHPPAGRDRQLHGACPYMVLMPIFADRVLGGGPHTLGVLMAVGGPRRASWGRSGWRRGPPCSASGG